MMKLIFCALALFGAFTYGDEIAFRSDPGPQGVAPIPPIKGVNGPAEPKTKEPDK